MQAARRNLLKTGLMCTGAAAAAGAQREDKQKDRDECKKSSQGGFHICLLIKNK